MRRMLLWLIATLILAACGGPANEDSAPTTEAPSAEAPGPEVVATSLGGAVSLPEVESHLRQTLRPTQVAADELIDTYRQAAEALTIRQHVASLLGDPIQALRDRGEYQGRHRQAVLELFHEEQGASEISPDEARAFYEDNVEKFKQEAARNAHHIFRRHEDPAASDATEALLRDFKRRVLAGESFADLARQHSHSESRIRDGRLGWIRRGQVAKALEGPLFALEEGEVSDPIAVPGGAVIFHVTEAREEKQHSFEDVRGQIVERLSERRLRELVAEAVAESEPPVGSLVLEREPLQELIKAAKDDAVVLAIDEYRLTLGDFKRQLAEATGGVASGERVAEIYQEEVDEELLYRDLTVSGWATSDGREEAIKNRLVDEGVPWLVETWLEQRMRERVAADPDALRAFHSDNRHLYQSPLRLQLQSLSVAAEAGVRQKMVEIEALRGRLIRGEIDFATAAGHLGAEVADLGWLDFDQLGSLAPKVRDHVLALESAGFTEPFHYSGRLYLTWVRAREEPEPLPFDAVAERVRDDYYERFKQRLYREVSAEILEDQGFHFYAENVRLALSLPLTP